MKKLFKLYHWVLWNIITRSLFIALYLRRTFNFCLTSGSHSYPPPPYIVVANHGTFFDPWIVGSYSNVPFGFMTNDDGFRDGIITRWYLKGIGAFPKKKGASDFRAMKKTLNLLKNGVPVCIFPEGQTTWDGETQLLYPGIEKLVKRAGCPLVTVRLQGNFLTKPWWARSTRKGTIRITVTVHSPETLEKLTDEEIFELIRTSIYQNDIKDRENLALAFSGSNLADGLERFVWICMQCNSEDTLTTNGNRITCSQCSSSWEIDAHCRIKPLQTGIAACNDLKDWVEEHKSRVQSIIGSNPDILTRSSGVVLQLEDKRHTFTDRDSGIMTLTATDLHFAGPKLDLHWPVTEIEDYVIQKKDLFEFRHQTSYQRFVFSGKSPMKWIYYIRYLKGFEQCEKQGHL